MRSIQVAAPPEVVAAFDALDEAVAAVGALDVSALDNRVRLRVLERLETARRRQVALSHEVIAELAKQDQADVGGPHHKVIGDVLRISYAEARRRVRNAQQLTPRMSISGQQMPADLPATAQAWRQGVLDDQHLRAIQKFFGDLPDQTPVDVVKRAETFLAQQAAKLRPDQLEKVADRYLVLINPDGKFCDVDRARRRGFLWCAQRADGMSIGKLTASPELRANLDAWMARFAAPGMCDPDDQTPVVSGQPSEEATGRDARTHPQRQHDALNALVRGQLGDPKLGIHNGLPVTVIVSTTLTELASATGQAVTGGGTLLPMSDVIAMASHAYHYFAIFNDTTGRALHLGRTRRIASADQRIVLHAKDRGCTFPGCDAPGYISEVHHINEWAAGGATDIDNLTFGCKPHHKLIDKGWRTRKLPNGDTQWIPPPQLELPAGTNNFHHVERYLPDAPPN